MKKIFDTALRHMKDYFTEPVMDFQFAHLQPGNASRDPLFDPPEPEPMASQSHPGNQAAVLNALAHATENYFLSNISPLLRNVPHLRWQIKQIQICETADNMQLLKEINQLSPSILHTVSKAILAKLPCAHAMDLSRYYGLCIVPGDDLIGRTAVTWASVGLEKTPMQFYFDDEIIECAEEEIDEPEQAIQTIAFHLNITDQNGTRKVDLTQFPAVIGSGNNAGIQVNGPYVSAQHLVLQWDAVLQCVYLIDRSKHGTYLHNGKKIADGERRNLIGEGYVKLTNQANAPRLEYWYGAAPHQGTALLPSDVSPRSEPSPDSTTPIAKAIPPLAAFTRSLRAANPAPSPRRSAPTRLHTSAQRTMLTGADQTKPLAWLQVRTANKQIDTVAINALPFSIGREFDGNGFPVDPSCIKVARNHLRLLEQRGNAFGVHNDSLQRPGQSNLTVGVKGAENLKFVWVPHPRNSNSGWRVLGANRLDVESVEVRLINAEG